MLAPSATIWQPFLARLRAASSGSSFWLALGRATSHGTSQTLPPSTYSACATRSASALMRARLTSLTCFTTSRSIPFSSTT